MGVAIEEEEQGLIRRWVGTGRKVGLQNRPYRVGALGHVAVVEVRVLGQRSAGRWFWRRGRPAGSVVRCRPPPRCLRVLVVCGFGRSRLRFPHGHTRARSPEPVVGIAGLIRGVGLGGGPRCVPVGGDTCCCVGSSGFVLVFRSRRVEFPGTSRSAAVWVSHRVAGVA